MGDANGFVLWLCQVSVVWDLKVEVALSLCDFENL